MSEAEDLEHAIYQAVQELIGAEARDLKADLGSLRDDVNMRFDAFQVRTDLQGKAILAAIKT